ncbi:hypothetical protein [Secundilactobacillus oryzae]|nr:hypothetical protein [Secundilactobacillus oryzae]
MTIKQIQVNEVGDAEWRLLLEADPDRTVVLTYLADADIFVD